MFLSDYCSSGSDRSSVFVGLSILLQQFKREGVVDVFSAARILRSQRMGNIAKYVSLNFTLHFGLKCFSQYFIPNQLVPKKGSDKQ